MNVKCGDILVSTDIDLLLMQGSWEKEKLNNKGLITEKPNDIKIFLCNDEYKQQLIELRHDNWLKYIEENGTVILIMDREAFHVDAHDGAEHIPQLKSNQEETDSKVVLYRSYAAKEVYQYARVRRPNSEKILDSTLPCKEYSYSYFVQCRPWK